MARTEKLAGAIISLLLNTAHLRVHRMVRVLGSKLFCELLLELAKLARYSAVFSPQGRPNLLFLHSEDVSKFLPFHQRGTRITIPPRATRNLHGSPPPPPRHHKDITDSFPYALHTHTRSRPCMKDPDPAPRAPSTLYTVPDSSCIHAEPCGQLHRACSWEARPSSWKTSSHRDLSL